MPDAKVIFSRSRASLSDVRERFMQAGAIEGAQRFNTALREACCITRALA
ncbi:MAG: hypothetical protein AAGC57_18065 [Pseudomonadota bacterium]